MIKRKDILKIAIDSPAAAGAGTIAKAISKHYNLAYLDTGSFSDYLAVVTMGLMVGYAETCPDEVLSQLCS